MRAWIIGITLLLVAQFALLAVHIVKHHPDVVSDVMPAGGAQSPRAVAFRPSERGVLIELPSTQAQVLGSVAMTTIMDPTLSLVDDATTPRPRTTNPPQAITTTVSSTARASAPPPLRAICPGGYSLEEHAGDAFHGDVCRAEDQNFVCPSCCTQIAGAPYCSAGPNSKDACRADVQFSACFNVSKDAPTLSCPPEFHPLVLTHTTAANAAVSKTAVAGVSVCVHNTRSREWVCPSGWTTVKTEPFCIDKQPKTRTPTVRVTHLSQPPTNTLKTMYTFFQPIGGASTPPPRDQAVLDAWSNAWASAGWATRILTLDDAKKHPRFVELEARIVKLPLGGNIEYDKMCFIRCVDT